MTFYNFARNDETGGAELYIDGVIATGKGWFEDAVTPRDFRRQLAGAQGDLTVFISSPGGDVFAGAEIYTALKEYKGTVTVKVSGIAASAASIIAMGGDKLYMSPGAYLMIHNAWTCMAGNQYDMEGMRDVLQEIDKGLITVYEARTGKPRDELAAMLKAGTYMSAQTAVDEGFADGILYTDSWKAKHTEDGQLDGTRAKLALLDNGAGMASIAACIAKGDLHTGDPGGAGCPTDAHGPQDDAGRSHIQDILARVAASAQTVHQQPDGADARRKEIAARAKLIAELL